MTTNDTNIASSNQHRLSDQVSANTGLELFETLHGSRDTLPVIMVSGRGRMTRSPSIAGSRNSLSASMLWCKQGTRLCVLVLPNAVFDRHFTCATPDLSLPTVVKELILVPKPRGSWRMSMESGAIEAPVVSQRYSA